MDPSKLSFQRFRNILRLAQPKPLERHFTLDQLFAISLDLLNENALLSIRPGEPREHDSRALSTQETLDDDRHRRDLLNPNFSTKERVERKRMPISPEPSVQILPER